jgi:hypothetical protein
MKAGTDASIRAVIAPFAAVFVFMFADTMMQTALPVTLKDTGAASAGVIGAMVALPQGIGFLTALPAAAHGDRHGTVRLAVLSSAVAGVGACFALVVVGRSVLWWLLPVLAFGLGRLVVWISILTTVSTTGDAHLMQGFNGATQRGAAAAAAVACTVIIAHEAWRAAYLAIALAYGLLIPLSVVALRRTGLGLDASPDPKDAYRFAVTVSVHDHALRAASLVAVACTGVMILGSSFFALTLHAPHRDVARTLAILLLARDFASILVGPLLPRLLRRLGIEGTVVLATGCGALGVLGLALPADFWAVTAVAAALQGACICLCIGCTNLLAVDPRGGLKAGPGMRIAAANLAPCLAGLVLPVAMGAILGRLGGTFLFVSVAVTTAAFGGVALMAIRSSMASALVVESAQGAPPGFALELHEEAL